MWVSDPELSKIHARMVDDNHALSPEVTVITAYFNIGSLNKGGPFGVYTPEKYIKWMSVFGRIDNPLIVFTDSLDVKHIFEDLRKDFAEDRTQIYLIDRRSLWAFQLAPEIKQVFSQPHYPNHDPNTVHENYSCVMHAKFELVNKVIQQELYHTRYLAWLDIGLFRAVVDEKHIFPLTVPPDFDDTKVAYSGQAVFDPSLTPMEIVAGDKVWVGGAMFLARPEVLYIYTQDYMRAVRKLLDMRVMSTDQQVRMNNWYMVIHCYKKFYILSAISKKETNKHTNLLCICYCVPSWTVCEIAELCLISKWKQPFSSY